jgi:quercetin dioxygenase-like cupin family protein
MSDYTKVNLLRVEDQAPKFGYSPGLQSRFARVPLGLRASGISHFRYAPGFRIPFGHHHEQQEEVYVVLAGSVLARLDDEALQLGPLDALRVGPATVRAFEAGPDGADVLVFGSPSDQNRDAHMVPGWWPAGEDSSED